jgi:nucleoside-diphosphate-sugar epimerase
MHVGRYVYISSDSVYEVCKPSNHGGPSREEDAVRPEDPEKFKELAGYDYYGDSKLGCEEVLQKEHKESQLNYISLRLPDVIGPRDNTDRFWIYFLWVKFQDVLDRPINFPPNLHNQQISFVMSDNVAMLLLGLNDLELDVFNQAYNLACEETVTLKEFITIFGQHIGVPDVKFDESTVERPATYFPSVKRGPLNVTKAQKLLKWKSYTLSEGIKKNAGFYNYAMKASEFKQQRDGIVEAFIPDSKMGLFKKKYEEIYGVEFKMKTFHNEL